MSEQWNNLADWHKALVIFWVVVAPVLMIIIRQLVWRRGDNK